MYVCILHFSRIYLYCKAQINSDVKTKLSIAVAELDSVKTLLIMDWNTKVNILIIRINPRFMKLCCVSQTLRLMNEA